jgi:hypothetical protein
MQALCVGGITVSIFYCPPYDSPIEDSFAKYAEKYFNQEVSMDTQVEIITICGNYRLDFVVTGTNGKKTAIECDGKEFHNESRDEWRDAMILGSSDIDEIYRIKGKEITYRIEDVFYALSVWSPWLFDDRQKYNLQRIATEEVLKSNILPEDSIFSVNYIDAESEQLNQFYLEKRHKNIPEGMRQFWQVAFNYAQKQGGGNLDEVIAQYRSR